MNSELNKTRQKGPVSPASLETAQMDLWEPPFERWMRIADSLLDQASFPHFGVTPRPQSFVPAHRG